MILLRKAMVEAYDRHGPGGKVVHVNAHTTRAPAAAPAAIVSYRSGASSPNIMRGYIVSRTPLGVALPEVPLRGAGWDMMVGYAQRGGHVFVDSGAFSAFTLGNQMDWPATIAKWRALIQDAAGARMHIVMPDVVGDQTASLNMLAEHRDVVRKVIDGGQDALVPVQKGALPPYQAWRAAVDVLGTDDFTVSIPSNAAAFGPADLANLMSGPEKPARVHLLGIAGNRKKLAELARIVHGHSPGTILTSDANRLRAQVGQGRPVTAARPKWALFLRQAFDALAEDLTPEARAAWHASDKDRVVAPGVAGGAIAEIETRERERRRAQTDLFAV